MTFNEEFDKIVDELSKEKPKPPPKNSITEFLWGIEATKEWYVGILTSGQLSSQRQIKLRKQFSRFCDEIVKITNPDANIIMTNEIYLKHLKDKKLRETS